MTAKPKRRVPSACGNSPTSGVIAQDARPAQRLRATFRLTAALLFPAASAAVAASLIVTAFLLLTAFLTADSADFGTATFTVRDLPAFSFSVLVALAVLTEAASVTVQFSSQMSLIATVPFFDSFCFLAAVNVSFGTLLCAAETLGP